MASPSLNQELQTLILHTIEKQSSIADTSKLILHSAPSTPVDQQVVQAVLTSLASRNVRQSIAACNHICSHEPLL